MNFSLTTQDIWCILISEHKMLFYLTLYKGLIQLYHVNYSQNAYRNYLTLYKELIHVRGCEFFIFFYYLTLYKGLILFRNHLLGIAPYISTLPYIRD